MRYLIAFALLFCSCSLALGFDLGATPASSFRVPEGFSVELVYEVPMKEQGSWVNMCVDLKGRLIVSDQYGSLYRVTPAATGSESSATKVEKLDVAVGMAQGLLHTKDGLYVDVNAGGNVESGVYRLQDLDGDDQFEKIEHLIKLNGGGEHGPHAIIPGPDGRLYICAGNQTDLPAKIDASRVPRIWSEDHMLGRMPDARGFMATRLAPGGFVLSMKPDGSDVEVVSTGFRNEYDIAFNPNGDLFTYDADMEWDIGTPWYRPTRVNHVISGAEFGWRNGTGKWPEYFADSFGAVANIGYGSPTGITFGTGAKFPAKYQNALFIGDWSYGVVYAVHLEADGASYKSTFEPFATASPMPITDIVVHPTEGCMYVTIGGRKVQSALYRISYRGSESTSPAKYPDTDSAMKARAVRRSLEKMHRPEGKFDPDVALKSVGSDDRSIRTAARIALEHQDVSILRSSIGKKLSPQSMITLAVGLCRKGEASDQPAVQNALLGLDWTKLSNTERVELLRAYQLSFLRLGEGAADRRNQIIAKLDKLFPTSEGDSTLDRELARLLIYLQGPHIVDRCVAQMKSASSPEQQIHYAFCLREVTSGWTDATRKAYFQWFYDIASARGGASFGGFIENIRQVAISKLSNEQKSQLGDLVGPAPVQVDVMAELMPRSVVKEWTIEELEGKFKQKKTGFDFERGKQMFAVAQCYKCHRFAGQGGIQGPDLSATGKRFNLRDMLTAIVDPSKEVSDQYEATIFQLEDQTVIGRVANLNGNSLSIATNMLDPGNFINVERKNIVAMKASKVSMMPKGLLDTLTADEVSDLVAYLQSGGNPKSEVYESR